ncbi:MAG TPA: MFS transporter [Candidatus Acidoferrales bacterium]|nr:MFS transporter [Candidatus Acidoferrales bacterium]
MSPGENQPLRPPSPWRPLHFKTFRNLLAADLISDVGTFMQTVGAAWLMTSLTSRPLYIALIQTASALPFFILALPAGSIGDIVDRRKLILVTESWMLGVATLLAVATFAGLITPWLLLLLTFALSAGDAVESPSWIAIFPELVTREDLAPALALNGIEFNLARAVGPGLAGVIVGAIGVGAAFVLNALSFLGVIGVIARWKRKARTSCLPAEKLAGATEAALRYVRYSPQIRALLFRSVCVMFFASAFWALLPAIAKGLSGSALVYGLLLGVFGSGAVIGAIVLQRTRSVFSVERLVAIATTIFAGAMIGIASSHRLWTLYLLGFLAGVAWTIFMSIFNTLVQTLAPDWVRARVSAVYLLVYQGAFAAGSALWGLAAERSNSHTALLISGIGIGACVFLQFLSPLPASTPLLEVWDHWKMPAMFAEPSPEEGPVLVTVEYSVDPAKAHEFLDAIYKYQRIRRRDGASSWSVFYDAAIPGRYFETFLVDSWAEHERQHARFTVADSKIEKRVLELALEPPKTRHFIHAEERSRHATT